MGGRGWGSESKRECLVLPQISKESAEYMVEEYKRLRQRDSTGGSVAMATQFLMESVILTSFTYIPSLPSFCPTIPPSSPPFLFLSFSSSFCSFPSSLLPLPLLSSSSSPHRDHKVIMEDYCAPVGEHDTSVRGHGTPALHRGGQEITWQSCD